ncbi:hypothetical protein N7532_002334 [Penicillium argentinense]|uniref:Uncharacterized protein n=1 Tax=Penicillium argentinense TaxID=1131581 RepID=A0A9W9G055_9EURO|nr:uncharacterized protein N7532_002334 [Penicillium argentinense]KAJ5109689.1 hypothetical protein N7532_002334 [Penicillium argentinense]
MRGAFSFLSTLALLTTAIGVDASRLSKKSSGSISASVPRYIRMPIDHFNKSDHRTFPNRYYVNDTYYEHGGPVFLYDAGESGLDPESAASTIAETYGQSSVMQLTRKYHGIAIAWEHRYFGTSLPFPLAMNNGSITDPWGCYQAGDDCTHQPVNAPDSYEYLTIDQALEDAVYFAHHFRLSHIDYPLTAEHTPWIFIGGSYPGSRAAFVRQRNPKTFYASWASSAPVESRLDGSAYYNTIERSISEPCRSDWIAAINHADDIMDGKYGKKAFVELQKLLYVAEATTQGLNSSYDISEATTYQRSRLASLLQAGFGASESTAFQYEGPAGTVDIVCRHMERYDPSARAFNHTNREEKILSNPGTGKLHPDGIAEVYSPSVALEALIYGTRRYQYEVYLAMLKQESSSAGADDGTTKKVQVDPNADTQAWYWIVATALGDFQGSNPANISIVSRYSNWTAERTTEIVDGLEFNPKIFHGEPDVSKINKYGGWKMNPTHVMFTNGQYDPWRGFSVASQDTNYGSPERKIVQDVPKCHTAPEEGTAFGWVYPGQVHVSDFDDQKGSMSNKSSPMYQGVTLFSKALDAWLPCFNKE